MDEYRHNEKDPWDQGLYETGRTKPPKRYGGMIAILLVLVIFLSGLVSVLGILNVKLFTQLSDLTHIEENDTISFISETGEASGDLAFQEAAEQVTEPVLPTEGISASINLNPAPASVDNIPQEGGMSLQDIYSNSINSVVSISCTTQQGTSTGTGVVLSADGYLVTNCHVVENAFSISVLLTDGQTCEAVVVGSDAVSDLAVLYIEAEDLVPAQFGDSSQLQVGDSVVAIGDPLGIELRGTMTNGIISAINRDVTTGGRTMTLIQTNAALNSGNSGGPLINCHGQVIGITSMKISTFTDKAGVEGIGFAIPSATVKDIVEQLISQGYVSGRPTLGLTGEGVSNFYQYYYRMPAGLYISQVSEYSSAARVGIEPGDILISIDDVRITDMDSLNEALYSYEVGDTVTSIIYRSGIQYTISLTLTESKG